LNIVVGATACAAVIQTTLDRYRALTTLILRGRHQPKLAVASSMGVMMELAWISVRPAHSTGPRGELNSLRGK